MFKKLLSCFKVSEIEQDFEMYNLGGQSPPPPSSTAHSLLKKQSVLKSIDYLSIILHHDIKNNERINKMIINDLNKMIQLGYSTNNEFYNLNDKLYQKNVYENRVLEMSFNMLNVLRKSIDVDNPEKFKFFLINENVLDSKWMSLLCDSLDTNWAFNIVNVECFICLRYLTPLNHFKFLNCNHRCCMTCLLQQVNHNIIQNPEYDLKCSICRDTVLAIQYLDNSRSGRLKNKFFVTLNATADFMVKSLCEIINRTLTI